MSMSPKKYIKHIVDHMKDIHPHTNRTKNATYGQVWGLSMWHVSCTMVRIPQGPSHHLEVGGWIAICRWDVENITKQKISESDALFLWITQRVCCKLQARSQPAPSFKLVTWQTFHHD